MQVRVVIGGMVQTLDKVKLLGDGAAAVNGPLVTLGSRKAYAYGIETGRHRGGRLARRAGGAKMIEKGIQAAFVLGKQLLPAAIVRGPAAVGAAKRKMRDRGTEVAQANTPVRSGGLRTSVSELNRPGIG